MSEWSLQIIAGSKLAWVGVYAFLYALGGLEGTSKGIRRYWGSLWLTCGFGLFTAILGAFSWYTLLCLPLYIGATSLGYGADKTWKKILKRTVYALAIVTASLPVAIVNQAWVMLGLHTVVSLLVINVLGVINPVEARNEELLIGLTAGLLPMFYF